MKLNEQDYIDLLDKASGIIDYVISELPDDNDLDDMDTPFSYLINAVNDIQDAINVMRG